MPTPSLLIVPARFKSGKLYSQIPTSGAGDFTVTRATSATRVNASGLIESVTSGIPRLDYFASGGTAGCPALLVEPAATNLCLQSEAFNTTWTRVSGGTGLLPVITANAVVAPDGTTTAETIVFDRNAVSGTANFSQIQQTISLATSGTYTLSVYAKATAAGDVGKQFYIRAKDVLVSGALTSSWVRYTSTETGVASGNTNVMIGNRGGFTADQSVSVDLWGAQLETGSVATSYIPTTTGSVTRNADVISVSGAVSGSIGQRQGTIYCEFAYFGRPINRSGPLYLRQSAYRGMSINSDSINTGIAFGSSNDGGSTFITLVPGALQLGTYYKIAIGYDAGNTPAGGQQANGVVAYVNGVQVATGTLRVPDPVGLSEFRMYSANSGSDSEILNDRIRAVALYTTRLTNAQLAALTT